MCLLLLWVTHAMQVTPRVGLLAPDSSMRVQVDFSPPALPAPAQTVIAAGTAAATPAGQPAGPLVSGSAPSAAAASSGQAPAADASATQTVQQGQLDPATSTSSTGHYKEWLLPCYIKACPSSGSNDTRSSSLGVISLPLAAPQPFHGSTNSIVGRGGADGNTSVSSSAEACRVLHVSVTTCAISPELHVLAPEMPKPPGKNYSVLDFGALPVGERATRELLLENKGALLNSCCQQLAIWPAGSACDATSGCYVAAQMADSSKTLQLHPRAADTCNAFKPAP